MSHIYRRSGSRWPHGPSRTAALLAALVGAILVATHAPPTIAAQPEEILLVPHHPETRSPGRVAIVPEAAAWNRLFRAGSARVIDFPLPNGARLDLDVTSFDLVDQRTRLFVGTKDAPREVSAPEMRFFRGQVVGDLDSIVSLTLFQGRIAGFLRSEGREYTFGPRDYSLDHEGAFDIEMRDDTSEDGSAGRCDGDDKPEAGAAADLGGVEALDNTLTGTINANTVLRARIAVEGTVEWVAKHGGVAAATNYTLNLLAQVSAIYESEVKVQLQVPYVLMNAAEPDGYSGASNSTSTVIAEMRTKWNGTPSLQGVFRSAAHVFSTYPSGGSGRSYIDTLCDNVPVNTNSFDYGVSLLDGKGGSWERRLVAHELGHSFSSPHSHCYAPELDQCANSTGCYTGTIVQTTGTIMSYCDARLSTFHQRERDEAIRPGAEAAFPTCVEVAGLPGDVGGLAVGEANTCGGENLQADDGGCNSWYGLSGALQAAWVKRFTPSCYPFKLTSVDAMFSHTASVAPGRSLRLLVYTDRAGSGSPATATLVHSQDTTVQAVGAGVWSHYTLASPVIISGGDFYLGFFDLVADTASTYLMDYDSSLSGDSWRQAGSTDPASYTPFTSSGTWLIRAQGGAVDPGSVVLSWGLPCNDATVPGQDFAVYQGSFGSWTNAASVTCTTGRTNSWLLENPPANSFWLVVPQNSSNEGSYGTSTSGPRPPTFAACKPQAIGACP